MSNKTELSGIPLATCATMMLAGEADAKTMLAELGLRAQRRASQGKKPKHMERAMEAACHARAAKTRGALLVAIRDHDFTVTKAHLGKPAPKAPAKAVKKTVTKKAPAKKAPAKKANGKAKPPAKKADAAVQAAMHMVETLADATPEQLAAINAILGEE